MALTNAEKQARWRGRHADQRRRVPRIATLLMRRSHSTGRAVETKVGWNTVTFDGYFYTLASLICDVLKTDRAIKQLRWALAKCLGDRRFRRQAIGDRSRRGRRLGKFLRQRRPPWTRPLVICWLSGRLRCGGEIHLNL
jgi:hypothetical protein